VEVGLVQGPHLSVDGSFIEANAAKESAPQSDLILQFREQGFHLLSLPLCFGELWRVDQLPRTLSGWFVLADHAGGNCEDAWSA
jgi:hypothetical protein